MRILITNNTLDSRAGSELYVRDLAVKLLKRGHTPIAYSTKLGDVAQEIRNATIPVIDNLDALAVPPEVIHGQHHLDTMTALLRFPGVPAVYFCHGWLPWEEAPPRFPRILKYVAVDSLCRERLVLEHAIPDERVELLLNFVDLERFKSRADPLPPRPRRALVFSNYANQASTAVVRDACNRRDILLDVVGLEAGNACLEPEQLLGSYDLIFARGKSALEALAVGAAVILCGVTRVGPMVTTSELEFVRPLNLGLRALNEPLTADAIERQIARYDTADAASVSRQIRASADCDEAVEKIISFYQEVIAENASKGKLNGAGEAVATSAYLRWLTTTYKAAQANSVWLADRAEESLFKLSNKQDELDKIKNTFGWRLLNRYGLLKHRFLLPAYQKVFSSKTDAGD